MNSAVPYSVFPSFAIRTVTIDYICKESMKSVNEFCYEIHKKGTLSGFFCFLSVQLIKK